MQLLQKSKSNSKLLSTPQLRFLSSEGQRDVIISHYTVFIVERDLYSAIWFSWFQVMEGACCQSVKVIAKTRSSDRSNELAACSQRIIVIDAILDEIFSFSTPRTIINISKTCRAARPIAASYFRAAYKPERLLHQFLPGPAAVRAFRTLQAETGLTIFGKAAYDFLARASFSATDTVTAVMNLYVDKSYASLVNDFFTGVGYDVEMREHELVFLKKGGDNPVINEVLLQASHPDSFDSVDKPRNLPIELMDVITFDGAYSLFPARYDDDEDFCGESGTPAIKCPSPPHHVKLKPMYRSFSDRSSWVVNFEHQMSVVPPPELAFGTSLPVRDPLYTSSLLVSPPKGPPIKRYHGNMQFCGVVLRSRLLRLTHILCSIELSQFVQQFLTRLVIAHPGRSNSHFDTEVTQFLHICLETVDIRNEFPSYSAVWAIMKDMAPLPSDTPGAGGLQWPCERFLSS